MKKVKFVLLGVSASLMLASCGTTNYEEEINAVDPPRGAYLGQDEPEGWPEVFGPNIICGNQYDRDITFNNERNAIYFGLSNAGNNIAAILFMERRGQTWSEPQVAPFSGAWSDVTPMFAPSGDALYFASNRPVDTITTNRDWNIWKVNRIDNSYWDAPTPVHTGINTSHDQYSPTLTLSGNMYYILDSTGQGGQIHVSYFDGTDFLMPKPLSGGINTPDLKYDVFVSTDESYLIYSSNGGDPSQDHDLYISYKEDTLWTEGELLGRVVNSDFAEFSPFVTNDDKYLFFTSDRTDIQWEAPNGFRGRRELINMFNNLYNGLGNIYWMPLEYIHEDTFQDSAALAAADSLAADSVGP